MRKLEKEDIVFLTTLLIFSLIAASRFFDHTLLFHSAPMGIMQQYNFSQLIYTVYLIIMFIMFSFFLRKTETQMRKCVYYLIVFLTIFMVPMYLYADYFGATDVYAWILFFLGVFLLFAERLEWGMLLMAFISTCLSPMSLFYTVCMSAALLFYRAVQKGEKKYLFLAAGEILMGMIGFFIAYIVGYFTSDAQQTLSWHRFLVVTILLSPYLVFVIRFWNKIIQISNYKMKLAYAGLIAGSIPSVFVALYIQDFIRAIFMFFVWMLLIGILLPLFRDEKVIEQWGKTEVEVMKYIPIPPMIIGYPLIILTLWIYGPLQLIVETVLGK